MTRSVVSVSVVCIAATLGASGALEARRQSAVSASPSSQTIRGSSTNQNVRVTGCLARDATGQLTLTSATAEPEGTTGSAGAAGGAMPESIQKATTFRVEGNDLDRHLGEKVEIVASVSAPPNSASSPPVLPRAAASSGAGPGRAAADRTAASAQRLDVKSVKSIHSYPCLDEHHDLIFQK
jgi:hypothetical protein